MQSQERNPRINLTELKGRIVKKIGSEKSKLYFYYLSRFLSQKVSKSEFDKQCYRVLGRENLPLHNQLIRSILRNACTAKTPPVIHQAGPLKAVVEDGHDQSSSHYATRTPNEPIWSNGVVLPLSPKKGRSGIRDRKLKDRPSSLGPNGKVNNSSHLLSSGEDGISKVVKENGAYTPCDYRRPVQHLHGLAEQPEKEREGSNQQPVKPFGGQFPLRSKFHAEEALMEDGEEVEQSNQLIFPTNPLLAPLGIPFCSTSVGGSRKPFPLASSSNCVTYHDSGGLTDTETLRHRMEQITTAQGLGGVSLECANTLNHVLDLYLKRLINSCAELVGARSGNETSKHPVQKQQVPGKLLNGMWPSNHLHMQNNSGFLQGVQEERLHCSISLLDFKVAMELNPQQLGEDWPLLLERICMNTFEE